VATSLRSASERAHRLALGAALLSVLMQSGGPIFVRKAGFGGLAFAFHRLWLASLVYAVVSQVAGRPLRWSAIRASALGGAMFAFNVSTFFVAVQRTSVANATVIGALQPVALLMVVNRFGERPAARDVVWTLVSISGVAVVVLGSASASTGDPVGDLLAFAAMLGYAGYYAASKHARSSLGAFEYQAALSVVATVALLPVVVLTRKDLSAPGASSWFWVAAMVAIPGTGHLLTNHAHGYVRLAIVSVLTLLVPVCSALLAWAVLDEPLVWLQGIGMVVTVGALAVMVRPGRTAAPPRPTEGRTLH
jgi:drug/metabolite transporter (DMT)-like permease